MLLSLATGALATLSALPQIDTTVPVGGSQRLEVDAFGGDITVRTWSRNAVRVQADPSSRAQIQISTVGSTVSLRTEGHRGPPAVDLKITTPAWMGLDLSGVNGDVSVHGSKGPITVETVQGSVDVTGGQGIVSLRSVQGSVTLRGARGRIEVHSVNEDVSVSDAAGELTAETVNGEITLARVDARPTAIARVLDLQPSATRSTTPARRPTRRGAWPDRAPSPPGPRLPRGRRELERHRVFDCSILERGMRYLHEFASPDGGPVADGDETESAA